MDLNSKENKTNIKNFNIYPTKKSKKAHFKKALQ